MKRDKWLKSTLGLIILFLLTVVCVLIAITIIGIQEHDSKIKVIIDTDAGVDDAVALILALTLSNVEVIAITCIYGNTNESNVENNVLKILTVTNKIAIPVYGGAKRPLLQSYTEPDHFGTDGLGDIFFDQPITASVDQNVPAAVAMKNLVNQYPGEIYIVTLGPLTNVALASSLDKNFKNNVKKFYHMGSRILDTTKVQDVDFNFGSDAKSNAIFFKAPSTTMSIIIPGDVIRKHNITTIWRKNVLGSIKSKEVEFLNEIEHANNMLLWTEPWVPYDSVAFATLVWPEIINATMKGQVEPITCGLLNGFLEFKHASEDGNIIILDDFDVENFKNKLLSYLDRR